MSVAIHGAECHWGGALALRITTLSSVWRQVAGAELSDRGDLSGQFVALRFDLFDGIHGSGSAGFDVCFIYIQTKIITH